MTYSLHQKCITEGCQTRVYSDGLLCAKCRAQTPEGKAEKALRSLKAGARRREKERIAAGRPLPETHCQRCVHWLSDSCSLGFPEGVGSFAEECSCYTVSEIDLNAETNHPDIQDGVQERLDRAYELAGRADPAHPQHCLYTNVFGELREKGLAA